MIYPTLEKYKGPASRHTCPSCGRRREFSRYVCAEGSYIGDDVGRCNRASCGYHRTPRQHFSDNPDLRTHRKKGHRITSRERASDAGQNVEDTINKSRHPILMPDYLDAKHLSATIGGYQDNGLVRFLFDLFPNDTQDVFAAIREYRIGTQDGFTVFPVIDRLQRFCKAQLIRYDPITGRRIKDDFAISSIQSKLKAKHLIDENFVTDKDIFFGEHLLDKYLGRPIAIVEAPKTAVVASICTSVFPDLVWLACLGKDNLNVDRIERLGRQRVFHLFPDTKGHDKWGQVASCARKRGLTVRVSDIIQRSATEAEKANDFDLADYLICEQRKRNDPAIREAFRDLIEERLAIMIADGDLTLEQAESEMLRSGFYERAISDVTRSGD